MPPEEPMDEGDIAADYQARHNQDAIARVVGVRHVGARHAVPLQAPATHCEWCEVEIPAGRRAAAPGCTLCLDCQAVKERLPGRL